MNHVIRTDRLLLREWRQSDVEPFAALNADTEVMRHFPSTLTAAQSAEMVERHQSLLRERGWGLWAAERCDTGAFIGFIGLSAPTWTTSFTPCVEIGWRLGRAHWGMGFAPEGAAAVLDVAFDRVPLPNDEVVSFTTVHNLNSQRVMTKIGMRRDPSRDFDHPMTPGWLGQRHVLFAITRGQWAHGASPPD